MMDGMIQAIVYDAVGTLIHVEPDVATIYAEVGRRFGSRLDKDAIRRRFYPAFALEDRLDGQAGWRTSEEREVERWQAIVANVLDDVNHPAGCFAALFERFAQPAAWKCDPEAAEVLAVMQQRGIRQAMASNFDRRLRGVIEPMPIAPFLDPLVISSEVGWRKPAPAFFTHLATVLDLPAETILFVGDDRGNDYEPAIAAGMQALLFDPVRQHMDAEVNRIERLSDVWERAMGLFPLAWPPRRHDGLE